MELICMEELTGSCLNPQKNMNFPGMSDLPCPYCLRRDGSDGFGNKMVETEKAEKVFDILKEKIKVLKV